MNTMGDYKWCVYSFNKQTGRREMFYGGNDFMRAFAVMTQELAKGFDVLLTDKEGYEFAEDYEWKKAGNGIYVGRVTYEMMKPYAVSISDYNFAMSKPNMK